MLELTHDELEWLRTLLIKEKRLDDACEIESDIELYSILQKIESLQYA